MKKIFVLIFALFNFILTSNAQNVAINSNGATANSSAMLDVSSTNSGVLIPRVSLTGTTSAAPVTGPATSLLVYNTATVSDVTPGYYFWSGTAWVRLYSGALNAWNLTGNSGTAPASNFIGTIDAQDWVIRTTNVERARILSGGNILFNRTTALYATDLFEAQGSATFPDAINGYTNQATGSGVYGECSAGAGIGVIGVNSTATAAGTGPGVYGQSYQTGAAGVLGTGSTYTRGVLGTTNNATYGGTQGQNAHADGDGVVGINYAASGAGAGTGVFGQCSQGGGAAAGVYGINDNSAGTAIIAYNAAASGTGNGKGVYGYTNQSGGSAAGVYAVNANVAGEGIIAFNSATTGTNIGDAIYGQTAQSNGAGAFLANTHTSGTGIMASGNNVGASYLTAGSGGAFTGTATGVYCKATTAASGTGCGAVGNNATLNTLTNGSGGAFTGTAFGVYGYATGSGNDAWGGYFTNGLGSPTATWIGGRTAGTNYGILSNGSKSTIVEGPDNNSVVMFCPESPEILFQDYGSGKLTNGHASITLDPVFSKNVTIDPNHPLRVFIQLEGNCNGVYVTNKTSGGFEVVELNNGQSDVEFSWTVVANRADRLDEQGNVISKHVDVRFPVAPKPLESHFVQTESKGIKSLVPENPSIKRQNINVTEISFEKSK